MIVSPDASVAGFLGREADPLRYGGADEDPRESAGIMRRLVPEGARVLDVGCGVGAISEFVNRGKNNDLLCLEPDSRRAAAAKARGLAVHEGLFDDDFAKDQDKFDVIVFGDVLEHLPDPGRALRLARDLLSESGRVVVSVPNVAHWTVRLELLAGKFDYQEDGIMDATHLRWFTKKTLNELLENHGFRAREIDYTLGGFIYSKRPWNLVPRRVRRAVVRGLTRLWPNVFACQFVVCANVAPDSS